MNRPMTDHQRAALDRRGHNDHIPEPQGVMERICPNCGEDTPTRRVEDCEHCGRRAGRK